MGRRISESHIASLVARYRQRLDRILAIRPRPLTERAVADELAIVCGLDVDECSEPQKERLRKAAAALIAAQKAGCQVKSGSEGDQGPLNVWIRLYLVDKGPLLLVSAKRRDAVLAQQRDATRRCKRTNQGLATMLISLPQTEAAKLDAFQNREHLPNRSAAICALISTLDKSWTKPKPPQNQAESRARGPDLFGPQFDH